MPETALHVLKNNQTKRLLALYIPELPLADHTKQTCLFKFQINTTTNNDKGAGMDFYPMLRKHTNAILHLFFACPKVEVEDEEHTQ